jgi:ketosteroid isomerase-like protein
MASEHVALMERLSEMWNAGDWDGFFAHLDDRVVFEDNLLPDGGTYTGIESVRRRFAELESVAGRWKSETETIMDAGADVVWIVRTHGRLDEDTPPFEVRAGAVISFEGNRIVRIRWFPTPEATLEAAGLGGA